MPKLSAARVKLAISATVMKIRMGSRFCIFVAPPGIEHGLGHPGLCQLEAAHIADDDL
jgi:hypothetical protein